VPEFEDVVHAMYAYWPLVAIFTCLLSGVIVRLAWIGELPNIPLQCIQFMMAWIILYFCWWFILPVIGIIGIACGIYLVLFCKLWNDISVLFTDWKNRRMVGQEETKRYKEIIAELEQELDIVRKAKA